MSRFRARTELVPAGYRYVIENEQGVPILGSGAFLLQRDAQRSGDRWANDPDLFVHLENSK